MVGSIEYIHTDDRITQTKGLKLTSTDLYLDCGIKLETGKPQGMTTRDRLVWAASPLSYRAITQFHCP